MPLPLCDLDDLDPGLNPSGVTTEQRARNSLGAPLGWVQPHSPHLKNKINIKKFNKNTVLQGLEQ